MAVTIGARENTFANPIGLMTDCHRRIEKFLGVLRQVACFQGRRLESEERIALEKALRYFREAAPRHTADEEEDLFPRLSIEGRPGVVAALAQLGREHEEAAAWHREVDKLGLCWLRDGQLSESPAARFEEMVARLSGHYAGHIALEETEIFPLAQAELGEAVKEEIGRKMAARRDAPFGGCP